jgi:Flp pilus assembly protein TadG
LPRFASPSAWARSDLRVAIRGLARSFPREPSGATAVETALVAAPFFALLIASLQLGLVYLCQSALELATEKVSRSVLTGADQTSGMTQQQFLSALCGNLPSILSCTNVMVDAQVYNTFATSNTSAPTITYNAAGSVSNQWSFNLGGANSIVVIRVMYLLPVVGALNFNITNQRANRHLLMATAVFKNEPYQ